MIHVALYQPDIPQNTGNIARTLAVTGGTLHLIRPLGFNMLDANLKRSGLDYWDYVKIILHDSYEDFLESVQLPIYLVTTKGDKLYSDIHYEEDVVFLFGSESKGVPEHVHERFKNNRITLPMRKVKGIRSLNLANTVCVLVFEAWRQRNFL